MSARARRTITVILGAMALSGAVPARADDIDAATRARQLAAQAGDLLAEARVEEACHLLSQSEALAPSVGTLQRLAACEEAQGRTGRALAAYQQLAVLGERELRGARMKALRARIKRLEAKVPRLTVVMSSDAIAIDGLEVRACGAPLQRSELGVPIAEDPGPCEVTAKAPGRKAWSQTVTLGSHGERAQVEVPRLDAESEATSAAATPPPPPEPEPPPPPPPPPPEPPRGLAERRITGIALLGLGAALGAGGGYFGYAATKSEDEANARCPRTTCSDPAALHANDRAMTQASLANLTIGAGVVALVAGVVVLATLPSSRPAGAASTGVQWRPTPGGVGGVF